MSTELFAVYLKKWDSFANYRRVNYFPSGKVALQVT